MAKIITPSGEKVFSVGRWLGVNENPDGITGLKAGEASEMRNFRVTRDGLLKVRPGMRNIASLLSGYTVDMSETAETVATDVLTPSSYFTCYPNIIVGSDGSITLSGAAVVVEYGNVSSCEGYYWQDGEGNTFQLGTCDYDDGMVEGVQQYRWEKWSCNVSSYWYYTQSGFVYQSEEEGWTTYTGSSSYSFNSITGLFSEAGSSVSIDPVHSSGTIYKVYNNGTVVWRTVVSSGFAIFYQATVQGPYSGTSYSKGSTFLGYVYAASSAYPSNSYQYNSGDSTYYWYTNKVQNTSYVWKFYPVTAVVSTSDTIVRGIWSGYVAGTEYILAACDGTLWSLTENGETWTQTNLGVIDTMNPVHFFGFEDKVYLLNGSEYKAWDGTTLSSVTGYRPLVVTECLPSGGGTSLEQVNKLTGARRVWFSPDGTATEFQLPEMGLFGVDYVTDRTTDTDYDVVTTPGAADECSVNLTDGTVTFYAAPDTGQTPSKSAIQFRRMTGMRWRRCATARSTTGQRTAESFFTATGRTTHFTPDLITMGSRGLTIFRTSTKWRLETPIRRSRDSSGTSDTSSPSRRTPHTPSRMTQSHWRTAA